MRRPWVETHGTLKRAPQTLKFAFFDVGLGPENYLHKDRFNPRLMHALYILLAVPFLREERL